MFWKVGDDPQKNNPANIDQDDKPNYMFRTPYKIVYRSRNRDCNAVKVSELGKSEIELEVQLTGTTSHG